MSLQPNSSSLHTGTCPTCPTCLTYPLSLQPVSSSEYHQCTYNPCTIEGCNTSDTSGSHPPCSSRDWMDGILEVGQNLVLDLSSIKDPHEFGRFGRYLSRSGCRNVIGHTRFLETRLPTKKTTYPIPSPTLGFKTPKKKSDMTTHHQYSQKSSSPIGKPRLCALVLPWTPSSSSADSGQRDDEGCHG